MFGEKLFPRQTGYPTPEAIPSEYTCLLLQIPASSAWWAIYTGLLSTLADEDTWQQFEGGISREDAAGEAFAIFNEAMDLALTASCGQSVPTPFWDEEQDVDDEAMDDVQAWYGTVPDAEADPASLGFVENAAIWAFTGFLAVATFEVGAYPAILFNTIAPRFVLAMRRGDLGQVIRILVDGEEAARINTSSAAVGDVLRATISADPELETHDIALIQVS